jgi:hypothetical protein
MEALLRRYKADHGRYPTTAEGLGVLDGYAVRYGLRRYHPCLQFGSRKLRLKPWPANEEELRALLERGLSRMGGHERDDPNLSGLEVGIHDTGYLHVLYRGEPLDITDTPYLYENHPSGSKSLMPADPSGMFSRQVDIGVRVGSFGLEHAWDRAKPVQQQWIIKGLIFGACVVALCFWWVLWWIRDRRNGVPSTRFSAWKAFLLLMGLFLGFLAAWVVLTPALSRAYETAESAYRHVARDDYRAVQTDLLSAELIDKLTYDRRVASSALEDDVYREESRMSEQAASSPSPYGPTTTGPREANEPEGP